MPESTEHSNTQTDRERPHPTIRLFSTHLLPTMPSSISCMLIATGSPFEPPTYAGHAIPIGQCNSAFIFPGVGLGVIACRARRVTEAMFVAAARALSDCSPARRDPEAALYPLVEDIRAVSKRVALAVAAEAQRAGLAEPTTPEELERRVAALMWVPQYAPLRRVAYG